MIALIHILAVAEGSGEEAVGGISALGLDPLAILAQAATFLVLFWVVKRFALEKIVKSLEERRKTIDQGVSLGLEMQAEKEKLDKQVAKVLQAARAEAETIIAGGQKQSAEIIQAAEEAASHKMDAMLVDARAKIADDTTKAHTALKQEILALVAQATEALIQEKLDARKDASLIERLLKKVGAA